MFCFGFLSFVCFLMFLFFGFLSFFFLKIFKVFCLKYALWRCFFLCACCVCVFWMMVFGSVCLVVSGLAGDLGDVFFFGSWLQARLGVILVILKHGGAQWCKNLF